jgi:hypothetical protein
MTSRAGPRELTPEEARRLIDRLEAEVNNGGFDQYFFNSSGDEASAVIEALETVGASKTARIVRKACARFPGGMPPSDRNERQDALERVSPGSQAFDREDRAFLRYEDDLAKLVAAYQARFRSGPLFRLLPLRLRRR